MASQKQSTLLDSAPETTTKRATRTAIHEGTGTKDVVMTDRRDLPAPVVVPASLTDQILALADRVGVDVIERLIALRDRERGQQAEAAFNIAFSRMTPEIPTIIERARTDKTTYAPLEDIIEVIRPIYSKHGFSLGFKTEWPDAKTVKVIGLLTHDEGHVRTSEFQSAADVSGSKNAIQALASTVTYGKRYVTKDLFCIVTRDQQGRTTDDDGETADAFKHPEAPDGYDAWWAGLEVLANDGFKALSDAWNKSQQTFRTYNARHEKHKWEQLKEIALGVDKQKAGKK